MLRIIAIVVFAGWCVAAANADPVPDTAIPPNVSALAQLVQEGQSREAQALVRAYAAENRVRQLEAQLAAAAKEKAPTP